MSPIRATDLLSLARTEKSGETYAFDRRGVLLSQSRFEHQLRSAGLLDHNEQVVSPLNIEIRDSGVDLTQGHFASLLQDQQPLTMMADQATRGATGDVVQGFTDNRQQRQLDQYELGEAIGRGDMGTVYRGRHQFLCRDVAIKVLEADIELSELMISRFEREVRITAQLQHPNTIDIYDFGHTDARTFFYVMEYVDGITLQELVDRFGRQDPARVIHLLLNICGSLSETHQLGMIHRDIQPSNILLTARAGIYDMIKVLDFGLVKRIDDAVGETKFSTDLTTADGITGTPMYMSPESVRDATTANERSDLYSVGAVGYILLTGETLFEGESSVDVCMQQLNDQPQRPSERIDQPLPEDLQNVLMSCLRKSPDERPLSADDLADSLRQCQDTNRWTPADAIHWWETGAN